MSSGAENVTGRQTGPESILDTSREMGRSEAFSGVTALFLTALLFCLLILGFTGSWLSESRRTLLEEWRNEERDQMSVLLARLRRLSNPETALPWMIRRNLSRIKPGRSPMLALAPLQRWMPGSLQFLFFDGRGKRITVPGGSTRLVAMSERVLQGILEINAGTPVKPQIRRHSSSFFGLPSTLEHLARHPGTLKQIRGGTAFSWAGWWGLPTTASPAAHLLLLVQAQPDPEALLRRTSLASSRSLLKGSYRLGEGVPPATGLIQSIEQAPGAFVWLESLRSPDPSCQRWIAALEAARIFAFAVIALILLTLLRTLWFRGRARLSLATLVTVSVLGSILPIGLATVIQASRYFHSAVRHLSWQAHRRIEQRLEKVDRAFASTMKEMERHLLSTRNRLAELKDPPTTIPASWVPRSEVVNAIHVLDRSGRLLSSFRGCNEVSGDPLDLSRALAYNLMTFLDARPLPPGTRPPTADLTWMRGLARHLTNNLGRLMALETMGYTQNCLISTLPSSGDPDDYRFFIAFVNDATLRRSFLKKLRAGLPGLSFGFVETGKAGPTSSAPDRLLRNPELLTLCEQTHRSKQSIDRRLTFPAGGTRLVTIIPTRQYPNLLLVGAVPFEPIRREIDQILAVVGFALLIVLFIAIGTARSWVGRLKSSLKRLGENLEAIDNRRFGLDPVPADLEMSTLHRGVLEAAHTLSEVYSAVPVQQTLLFSGSLTTPEFEIGGTYHSEAFLGGHLLEAMTFPDGRLLFGIGEVAGRPIPATLLVAKLKMAISFLGEAAADPQPIVEAVSRLLASPGRSEGQISLLIGIAGPGNRVALARSGEIIGMQLASTGEVFPVFEPGVRPAHERVLEPVDGTLVFFTPGWAGRRPHLKPASPESPPAASPQADPPPGNRSITNAFPSLASLLQSAAAALPTQAIGAEGGPAALAGTLLKKTAANPRDRSVLCLCRRSSHG